MSRIKLYENGKRMRFLLVSYSHSMANHRIALSLAEQLRKTGHACRVYDTVSAEDMTENDWFTTHVCQSRMPWLPLKKLSVAARHPVHAWRTYVTCSRRGFLRRACREICEITKEEQADYVICFSLPFETGYALRNRLPCGKLIAYNLDPYYLCESITVSEAKERERREASLFRSCRHIFTTPLLYPQYRDTALVEFLQKMTPLEFPCVVENDHRAVVSDIGDGEEIKCVYAGRLNALARNGEAVARVLGAAFKKQPRLRLDIYGDGSDAAFTRLRDDFPSRVSFKGRVSYEEALRAMNSADILINIGNRIANQLPSKTLTYISTGRPIVNFYELPCCPTLEYIERYPLGINIDVCSRAAAAGFLSFCESARGKRLSFSQVEGIYQDCTPRAVAQKVLGAINKEREGGK